MWRQLSILQLRFHSISQFLKFGIREPIRFRLVVQRNLERFSHALHDRGFHEHPLAIRGEELKVGGYSPLAHIHFREEVAEILEVPLHFSGAVQQIEEYLRKPLMIRCDRSEARRARKE